MSDDSDQQLVSCLNRFNLVELEDLDIVKVDRDVPGVTKLLRNQMITKAKNFHISVKDSDQLSVAPFMESLTDLAERISDKYLIHNFDISSEELVRLMAAAKHCKYIGFIGCTLYTAEEINFANLLDDATFEALDLNGSGNGDHSNWKEHPQRLENILKGLSQIESVKKHLKKIQLSNNSLEINQTKKMLKTYGFDKLILEILNEI